ncbi:Rossmann-fold NAD(P)-binding domain-containing protein [Streptomyces mesophilus]|uniref:hypothetical protein n=1 Tax=Streptomyces mesophilus TaxID=1775132 RepID=UPI001F1A99FB|nr:hypothetical protein [Streptomyces mesophilus]
MVPARPCVPADQDHPGSDAVRSDTADPESIAAAAESVLTRHPELNVLVPMAGIEVMTLLETQPHAKEIQVERVKFLRYGEAHGEYDQVVATLNASNPHGN